MDIKLTASEFRHLLDLVYIGNWILNSTRGSDRIEGYDLLQEKIFALAAQNGLPELAQTRPGRALPSRAYEEGGIHDAIADYEDAVFFDILAEELARRDMTDEHLNPDDISELTARMDSYMSEFEANGVENINLDL
ncbi:MAG: hypothetical protein LBL15_07090 [Oscillospiraceae bacterium]|jgi:hypothetical protein|nr:hypothetical protein [Oscillospiraceae bacterium]